MAQTLKFGNGTWATKKGSTLAFNDQDGNYKPLPFTTTRSTSATRVNKEGLIEVVESNRPRIDYTDSEDGVLLLEPSRSNLLLQSNQFDTTWVASNGGVVTSGQSGVGGSTDAWLLNDSDIGNTGRVYQNVTSSGVNTFSIYLKAGTLNWMRVQLGTTTGNNSIDVDLKNGVTGYQQGSNIVKSSISLIDSQWYRVSLTVNTSITQSTLLPALANNNLSGSGTIYIQNAQLEVGSYPSSYIPTQGSAVTRVAETASGSGNSEVFNDSEGVLFADISFVDDTSFKGISISSGANANSIRIYKSLVDNEIIFRVRVGDVDQFLELITLSNTSMYNKISLKYKENYFSAWVNGFEVATDLSGSVFSSGILNTLDFSNAVGGDDFYGKTKELAYYNTALTDAELETLTSYRSLSELVTELNLNTL